MRKEDEDDGDPNHDSVGPPIGASKQSQVADTERNLEEADTQLVERTAGKVDLHVLAFVLGRTQGQRQSETISRL